MSTLPVPQLWLDLSGTAIHLSSQLLRETFPVRDDGKIADKIILSIENESQRKEAGRFLNHITEISTEKVECELCNDSSILYLDKWRENGMDMKMLTISEKSRECYALILKLTEDNRTIPLTAIDAILSGKWIVLDTNSVYDAETRKELIADVVDLIFPFIRSQSNIPELLGGRIIAKKGGVAVRCRTSCDVFTFCSILQSSLASATGGVRATEEGVLWQAGTRYHHDISIALVLPFDSEIWRAATMIKDL
jgi:hypothetical protein